MEDILQVLRSKLDDDGSDDVPSDTSPAAVLIPIVKGAAGLEVVFTKRREDLNNHPGQVSFPGGKTDDGETSLQAALREANEELGIEATDVDILGRLSQVFTIVSGFTVIPWVGSVTTAGFVPGEGEIEEVFQVPLDVLRSKETQRVQRFIRAGEMFESPAYDVGGHIIWGATARILTDLLQLLDEGA
jgi:8-oxo-dGTP pyrophosphatase MutT (NUDIX family)